MKMKMNQKVKAKWTTALKSGDYQQGPYALRTVEGKFCCLGVLCDLAEKADVIPPAHLNEAYGNYSYGEIRVGIGNNGYLPPEVISWAGFNQEDNDPVCDGRSLSSRNDDGETFSQIADCIEANL